MQDLGKLLLRLTIGGLLVFYGIHKIDQGFDAGTAKIAGWLAAKDFPEFLRYGVFAGELLAPAMLVVGFWTRIAGLIVVVNMAFAVYLTESWRMWQDTIAHGQWALEHQAIFLLGGLCIALIGAGAISIDGRGGGAPRMQ